MKPALRFVLRHSFKHGRSSDQELGHESDEDRTYAIEAEALRSFVADDVGHGRWHSPDIRRRGQILVLGHKESPSEACFRGKIQPALATRLPKVMLTLPWSQQNFLRTHPERRSSLRSFPIIRRTSLRGCRGVIFRHRTVLPKTSSDRSAQFWPAFVT